MLVGAHAARAQVRAHAQKVENRILHPKTKFFKSGYFFHISNSFEAKDESNFFIYQKMPFQHTKNEKNWSFERQNAQMALRDQIHQKLDESYFHEF